MKELKRKRDPYIKVSASNEIKKEFNDFFDANKGYFITKANMMRIIVLNLKQLSKLDVSIVHHEEKILKDEIEKLKMKNMELEVKLKFEMKSSNSDEVEGKLDKIDSDISYVQEILNKIYLSGAVPNRTETDSSSSIRFSR